MTNEQREDPLAYGDFHDGGPGQAEGEGERGFIGDSFRRFRDRYQGQPHPGPSSGGSSQPNPPNGGPEQSGGLGSSLFDKLHGAVHGIGSELKQRLDGRSSSDQDHANSEAVHGTTGGIQYRYRSFAQQRGGNDVKWYVDGCGYMWAVSVALEQARESIWILDCKSRLADNVSLGQMSCWGAYDEVR